MSTPFAPPQKFLFPHQPSHSVFKPQQQKCRTRQWFLQALLLRNLLRWKITSPRSITQPLFRPSEWTGWSWSCVATQTRPRWPMLFLVFAMVSIWGSTLHLSHSNLPQVTCPLPCFNLRLLIFWRNFRFCDTKMPFLPLQWAGPIDSASVVFRWLSNERSGKRFSHTQLGVWVQVRLVRCFCFAIRHCLTWFKFSQFSDISYRLFAAFSICFVSNGKG